MDKSQIIELWRSLSPRLITAVHRPGPSKDDDTDEEERYGDRKEETADFFENHY